MEHGSAVGSPTPGVVVGPARRRYSAIYGIFAVLWVAMVAVRVLQQDWSWFTLANAALALVYIWLCWLGPRPRLLGAAGDTLTLQGALRTRAVARAEIDDIRPVFRGGFARPGIEIDLVHGRSIAIPGSEDRAQARDQRLRLRRWAGLPE